MIFIIKLGKLAVQLLPDQPAGMLEQAGDWEYRVYGMEQGVGSKQY